MWGVFSRKRWEQAAGLLGRPRLQESGHPWRGGDGAQRWKNTEKGLQPEEGLSGGKG